MVDEREKLILKLKTLLKIHNAKMEQWQKDNNLSTEVGCITREAFIMTSLIPEMQRLKISIEDYQ